MFTQTTATQRTSAAKRINYYLTQHSYPTQAKVLGNIALCYHRTHEIKTVESIKQDGFRSGSEESLYGPGIYLTFDVESQFTNYMTNYGDYIIKSKVALTGMLILDQDVARTVYGIHHSFADQCKLLKLRVFENDKWVLLHESNDVKTWLQHSDFQKPNSFSSDLAKFLFEERLIGNPYSERNLKLPGILFTGRQDGRVIVIYDRSKVIPLAYTSAPADQPQPNPVIWQPLLSKDTVKKVQTAGMTLEHYVKHFLTSPDTYTVRLGYREFEITQGKVKGDLYLLDLPRLKHFPSLEIFGDLHLGNCSGLVSLGKNLIVHGDFNLTDCISLVKFSPTNCPHNLILTGCSNLESLPDSLSVGQNLVLRNCPKLKQLPRNLFVRHNLYLAGSGITDIPPDSVIKGKVVNT